MMPKMSSLVAAIALLGLTGVAFAGQPLKLTNGQMDRVNAGSTAVANAGAIALGELLADTLTQTVTNVSSVSPKIVSAASAAQGLAAGGVLYQVGASVTSSAIAIW
jgi:hypothetical protein